MRLLRAVPAHPLLFALFPILSLYAANLAEADPGDAVVPALVSMAAAAVLLAGGTLVLRSAHRAAAATTAVVFLFFSYGYARGLLRPTVLGRHRILLSLWAILAVAAVVAAGRASGRIPRVTAGLNLVGIALVSLNLVSGFVYAVQEGSGATPTVPVPAAAGPGTERDVYYLVFDRYGGNRALQTAFGFDNSAFLDGLRARGFTVLDRSSGNYPRTLHSLASSMNMRHLVDLAQQVGEEASSGRPLREMIRRHAVGRFFKQQGYRYVHLGSWWKPTAGNPMADVNVNRGRLSEFSTTLLRTTALHPVAKVISRNLDPRRREYERTRHQFEALLDTAGQPGPTFVFGHFLVPHTPYVFNRDGSFVTAEVHAARSERERYLEQLRYVNAQVDGLIDRLLAGPETEHPIIILQSDEGPGERPTSWVGVGRRKLEAKFLILNALYLPGLPDPGLSPTMTPVNTFRTVLSRYFGAELPLLPDRVYVFRDTDHLYDFTEVTDRLDLGPP